MTGKGTPVRVGILSGFGINADVELGQAFEQAGAQVVNLPVTSLAESSESLESVQILGFPGGFSFGDHLGSGRVLAQVLRGAPAPTLAKIHRARRLGPWRLQWLSDACQNGSSSQLGRRLDSRSNPDRQ